MAAEWSVHSRVAPSGVGLEDAKLEARASHPFVSLFQMLPVVMSADFVALVTPRLAHPYQYHEHHRIGF